jgi:hypothetical protein
VINEGISGYQETRLKVIRESEHQENIVAWLPVILIITA